jgi:RimJ/RimL family protein N-acetyltransferase
MFEGASVRLRSWREADLPVMMDVRNNVALQAQLLARVRGSGPEQVREWLKSRATAPDSLLFIIATRSDDAAIGFLQVVEIDAVDRRGDLGICLLPGSQGRGVGTEAVGLLLPYLGSVWNLRKLSLKVRADNVGAIRCYAKAGFAECGRFHAHVFADGKWLDLVMMERFIDAGSG